MRRREPCLTDELSIVARSAFEILEITASVVHSMGNLESLVFTLRSSIVHGTMTIPRPYLGRHALRVSLAIGPTRSSFRLTRHILIKPGATVRPLASIQSSGVLLSCPGLAATAFIPSSVVSVATCHLNRPPLMIRQMRGCDWGWSCVRTVNTHGEY